MLALRDSERQNLVAYRAYTALHRLIPALGVPKKRAYFQVQREAEVGRIYDWWQQELKEQHAVPSTTGNPPKRKMEISSKDLLATPIDIPYLLLALSDPDTDVAYSCYLSLYRLLPILGAPATRDFFDANRAVASQPLFLWWEDELMGVHAP